jgi:hypothetical protein
MQSATRTYCKARDVRKHCRSLTKTMLVAMAADQSVVNVGFGQAIRGAELPLLAGRVVSAPGG